MHQEGVYEQLDGDDDMIVSLHFILQSDLWHVVQITENKNLFSILLLEIVQSIDINEPQHFSLFFSCWT